MHRNLSTLNVTMTHYKYKPQTHKYKKTRQPPTYRFLLSRRAISYNLLYRNKCDGLVWTRVSSVCNNIFCS